MTPSEYKELVDATEVATKVAALETEVALLRSENEFLRALLTTAIGVKDETKD